jgi:hypothetical protein
MGIGRNMSTANTYQSLAKLPAPSLSTKYMPVTVMLKVEKKLLSTNMDVLVQKPLPFLLIQNLKTTNT